MRGCDKKLCARTRGTGLITVVGFVPPSPGDELVAGLQKITTEEGRKTGMRIKLIEQSRLSVRASYSRGGANDTGQYIVSGNLYRGEMLA